MANATQDMPFIRNLASSDRRIRTSALSSLQTYLAAQRTLDSLTALKLWKGLFYAMWMCDKPIPQQRLCDELANLYTSLPGAMSSPSKLNANENVPIWFSAAWEVLAGSWTDIDVLRMEKFLLLVRRLFAAHLRWAAGDHNTIWLDEKRQDKVVELLKTWPLESEGDLRRVPLGLRLHVLDLWVDEMEKVSMLEDGEGEEGDQEKEEGLERAREFVRRMKIDLVEPLTSSPIRAVRKNAGEGLEDERLPWNRGKASGDGGAADDGDEEWAGFGD